MGKTNLGVELFANQRTAPRAVFHRRGELVISDTASALPIKTFDISTSGIGILCPHPVPTTQSCVVNVTTLHADLPELSLHGTVAYCILSGTLGFRVGIQYTHLDPKAKSLIDRMVAAFL